MADTAYAEQPNSPQAPKDAYSNPKSIEQYRRMLDDFRTTTEANRIQALLDLDYFDGKQLTPEERATLFARGQPDIWVNRVRVGVNGILGVVVRSVTDPKANPRNNPDQDGASVATDILRYSKSSAKPRWNRLKAKTTHDFLVPGYTAVLVGINKKLDVTFTRIRWEEYFYDYRSREDDFSDAQYQGVAKWMYFDDVDAIYPGKLGDALEADGGSVSLGLLGAADLSESMADRPANSLVMPWIDKRNMRILVVEVYHRHRGSWHKCVFWYGGILEEGPSPYLDEDKTPTCPIQAIGPYVDRDNNRYGIVRDMRPLQDEINKRRSKLLHLVNSSQIQARDPSAVEVEPDVARVEAARPDGVIPYGWEKVPTSDMAQGQMLLLTEAKNEMERFGPNPAVLGRQGADTSGRALLTRQQAGLVELATLLDQLEDFEIRLYIAAWQRVKQYWTVPKVVVITDDPEAPRVVGINKPMMGPVPMMGHNGGPALDDMGAPMVGMGQVGVENNVAQMNVDIDIDTAPATATIMQEQLKDLMALVGSNPAYGGQVPFEAFLELMPIPRKRQIVQIIKKYREGVEKAQAEQQALQMKMATETSDAKVKHSKSQTVLNLSKAAKLNTDANVATATLEMDSAVALDEMSKDEEEETTSGE